MPTNEQSVSQAKSVIVKLKARYISAVNIFNSKTNINMSDVLTVHTEALNYFNYCEDFVGNSDLLGAHRSEFWVNNFAEDCYAVLESLTIHYDFLNSKKDLFTISNSFPSPSDTSYANMQRMVNLYLNGEVSRKLKKKFKQKGLPIYGFNNETKLIMNKKTQTILSFSFGVVFITIILIIAIFQPDPTQFQQNIFWVVLSIAGGGTVATFPGFIEIKFGNWLRAGGALAVCVMIYFFKPASDPDSTKVVNRQGVKTIAIEQVDSLNNNPQQ